MEGLAAEYMKRKIPDATVDGFENLAIAFTYKQAVNFIRSTDRLKCWTITIAVLTAIVICTTIANIAMVVAQ
jgi:hypothetical protein